MSLKISRILQNTFCYGSHVDIWKSSPILATFVILCIICVLFVFCFTDIISVFKTYVDPEDDAFFYLLLKVNTFALFWFYLTDWCVILVLPFWFILMVLIFVIYYFLALYLHFIAFFIQNGAVTVNGNVELFFFFDLTIQINTYYLLLLIINFILFFIMIFIYIINIYGIETNQYSNHYDIFIYLLVLNTFFIFLVYSQNIFVNYAIFFVLQRYTYNIFFKNYIWDNYISFRKTISFIYYLSILLILIFLCLIFYLYYDSDISEISRRLIVIHGFYTENFEFVITFFNIKKVIILNLTNILFLLGFIGTLLGFISIVLIFIQFFIFIESKFFSFIFFIILTYFIVLFFNLFFKLDLLFMYYVDLDNNILSLLGIDIYFTSTLKLFIFILIFILTVSILILIL